MFCTICILYIFVYFVYFVMRINGKEKKNKLKGIGTERNRQGIIAKRQRGEWDQIKQGIIVSKRK